MTHKELPPTAADSSATQTVSAAELGRVAFFSALGGASSLIPLPVVDDWAWSFVRRRMVRDLLEVDELGLESADIDVLAMGVPAKRPAGCMARVLTAMVVTPLRVVLYILGRIFRKIFFVLAIKEATDRASQAFHQGYLLLYAHRTMELSSLVVRSGKQPVYQLSYAIEETIRATDTSPLKAVIGRTFRGSRKLLLTAAADLSAWARRSRKNEELGADTLEKEKQLLQRLWQGLTERIAHETEYLDRLAERFRYFAERRLLY